MFEQQSFSGDTLGADIAGIAGGERTSAFPKCELSAGSMSPKQPSIGEHAATLEDYGRPSIRRRGGSMMDRRVFVTLIAGTCLLEPFAVRAQQSGKMFDWIARSADRTGKCGPDRFGVSSDGSARSWLGGRQLVIETRWAARFRNASANSPRSSRHSQYVDPDVGNDCHPCGARWCSWPAHRDDQRWRPGGRRVR